MKNFYFLGSLIFLILIKELYSCLPGTYGDNCDQKCNCTSWSSNNICSKLEGRCLECKFGHFGKQCEDICRPECKTNLCCAIRDKSFIKSKNKIEFNASTIKIKIANYTLNIAADYNVGHPLTIFNLTVKEWNNIIVKLPNKRETIKEIYEYSDYTVNKADLFKNCSIEIGNEKTLQLNMTIIVDGRESSKVNEGINGVIGLGFLNSINAYLFDKGDISLNIASYEINNNDKVSILFGDLFKSEKDYVHKLSYCESLNEENNNNPFLRCPVRGMKRKSDSDALELNNINIQFSLNQDSSFILNENKNYTDYIIKYFFKNNKNNYEKINYTEGNKNINYYCFKSNKINKLTDFGFIIHKYFYSYKADKFFVENGNCSKGYSKFIIEFSNDDNVGLTFGKNFLKDTQITIDNEERKIYFYTKNVEYFSGGMKEEFTSEPDLITNPFESSLIGIGLILLLNVLSFLIYFYFKRKKEKIN